MEDLQFGEDAGVELCKSVIPYVQLGHVSEQVRLIWDHTGDLIQPDTGKQGLSCTGGDLSSVSRNMPQDMDMFLHTFMFYATDLHLLFPFVRTTLNLAIICYDVLTTIYYIKNFDSCDTNFYSCSTKK